MSKMNAKPSAHGAVAKTPAKVGMKSGAKQTDGNKMFKNLAAVARRKNIGVTHGKSGLPSSPTAKGRGVFAAKTQPKAFTNDTNVMIGGGFTKFVN